MSNTIALFCLLALIGVGTILFIVFIGIILFAVYKIRRIKGIQVDEKEMGDIHAPD